MTFPFKAHDRGVNEKTRLRDLMSLRLGEILGRHEEQPRLHPLRRAQLVLDEQDRG